MDTQVIVTLICKIGAVESPCEDERDDTCSASRRDPGSEESRETSLCQCLSRPILFNLQDPRPTYQIQVHIADEEAVIREAREGAHIQADSRQRWG